MKPTIKWNHGCRKGDVGGMPHLLFWGQFRYIIKERDQCKKEPFKTTPPLEKSLPTPLGNHLGYLS